MAKSMKKTRIVFLGAGNMAEALVRGVLRGRIVKPAEVVVTDVRSERLRHFRKKYKVCGEQDNRNAVRRANVVVLSVKPQQFGELLAEICTALPKRTLVLSIAAGIRTVRIEKALGKGTRVVRAMPNTPALVGAGIAGLCRGRWATDADMACAETILGAVGMTVRVREADMDAVTALSGSGPAYVFYFVEAMLEAARKLRMDAGTARKLIQETFRGAAHLLAETGEHPAVLRERVTSKGGTTAAALDRLRAHKVGDGIKAAVLAAHRRSKELSGM
ncbi:MAG: Pyrroline-5-carboxylate reductase [Verrucomicrobia bacterium ADurb.Bin345]|nr:MAG: Pyrroline-5-carboxylate reductase [Verrucomicrobia bacterium ADurb.Bin345]